MPTTTVTEDTSKPTISQVLGGLLQNAIAHPKTTIQAILSDLMGLDLLLLGCGCLSVKQTSIAFGVLSVCKLGLGMTQKDGINVPSGTSLKQTTQTTMVTPAADGTLPPKP
jgi:hypothetical protein